MDFGLKPAVFGFLTNTIAPPRIALASRSNHQKIQQVFSLLSKKTFCLGVVDWCEIPRILEDIEVLSDILSVTSTK